MRRMADDPQAYSTAQDAIPTPDQAAALLASFMNNESVRQIESLMLTLPQRDLHTASVLHGGMMARAIMIEAGTVLTGALMDIPNICIVVGDITVTTDSGPTRFTGCNILTASPGRKRIGVAHSDTWWVMLLRTDASTIEDAEDEMTMESDMLQTRRDGIEYERLEVNA
jgi:hypothetical protein